MVRRRVRSLLLLLLLDSVQMVDGYGILNLGVRYRRGLLEYQLNVNNVTDTTYFVPHQDYLQVYPGNPVNVLGRSVCVCNSVCSEAKR